MVRTGRAGRRRAGREGAPRGGGGAGGRRPPTLASAGGVARWCRRSSSSWCSGFLVSIMALAVDRGAVVRLGRLPSVFVTQLTTKVVLFVVGFVITAALVAASLLIAYRTPPDLRAGHAPAAEPRPVPRGHRAAAQAGDGRASPRVLGLLAGTGAAGQWQTFLLWRNGAPFGTKDPQFGLDMSFFVFTLPWIRFVLGFLTMVLVMALLAAAFTHYVYGGLQLQSRGRAHHARRPGAPRGPGGRPGPRPGRDLLVRPLLAVRPRTPRCSPASATPTPTRCCRPR